MNFNFNKSLKNYLPALTIQVVGIFLTLVCVSYVSRKHEQFIRFEFEQRAASVADYVSNEISGHAEDMDLLADFFLSSYYVDSQEFTKFTTNILNDHSGIKFINWIPRVEREDLEEFKGTAINYGKQDFQITELNSQGELVPASDREVYYPQFFVVSKGNYEAEQGFDLGTIPGMLQVLEVASVTGMVAIVTGANVVDENEMLLLQPVIKRGQNVGSSSDGEETCKGFVVAKLDMRIIIQSSPPVINNPGIAVSLDMQGFNSEDQPFSVLLNGSPRDGNGSGAGDNGGLIYTRDLEIDGTVLALTLFPNNEFPFSSNPIIAWAVLIAGLALTFVIGGMVSAVTNKNRMLTETIEQKNISEHKMNILLTAIEQSSAMVVITDCNGTIEYVNRHFMEVTGYEKEELMGRNTSILKSEGTDPAVYSDLWKTISSGNIWEGEFVNVKKNRETFIDKSLISPIVNDKGVITHYIAVKDDVTEDLEIKRALQESEERFRSFVNASQDAMIAVDASGRIELWNPAAEKMYGYSAEEIIGTNWRDTAPEDLVEDYSSMISIVSELANINQGTTMEIMTANRTGYRFPVEISGSGTLRDGMPYIIFTARDISERKKVETELKRLALIVEQAREIVVVGDQTGKIIYVNPAYLESSGYHHSEIIGKECSSVFVVNEDSPECINHLSHHSSSNSWTGTIKMVGKEGKIFMADVRIASVLDREGNSVYRVMVGKDITEELKLESELRQAQKLESIGQLAAGIAHEINTPTQYVGDNTSFLKESYEDLRKLLDKYAVLKDEATNAGFAQETVKELDGLIIETDLEFLEVEIPKAINQSLDGVNRVAQIVRAMKDFSHPGSEEKQRHDIHKAIENTALVARNEWKYVAEMEFDFDENLHSVPMYAGDFNQVILNMITNAAHAISEKIGPDSTEKGKIKVETRLDGKYAEIRISDTGTGIPDRIQSKVFDPFFTTKEVGKGTGQGLSISHSVICEKHGGSLKFETVEGEGSTFIIRLPIEIKGTKESHVAGGSRKGGTDV
jgi:PAS domain S-box-containing protein